LLEGRRGLTISLLDRCPGLAQDTLPAPDLKSRQIAPPEVHAAFAAQGLGQQGLDVAVGRRGISESIDIEEEKHGPQPLPSFRLVGEDVFERGQKVRPPAAYHRAPRA